MIREKTGRWRTEFSEEGGYDCMTGAWFIIDPTGELRMIVDQSSYGQKGCDYDFRSDQAAKDAELIVNAFNARDVDGRRDQTLRKDTAPSRKTGQASTVRARRRPSR